MRTSLQTKKNLLLFGMALLILVSGCKKDDYDGPDDQPKSFKDLVVSENFKFETTHEVLVTINIQSSNPQELPHIISVYEGDPSGDLQEIAKGMSNHERVYQTRIKLPTYLEEIYVQALSPSGYNQLITLPVGGDEVEHTFNVDQGFLMKESQVVLDDPGCSSGCENTLTSGGNVTLSPGVWCVPEGTNVIRANVKIASGATLRICGNLICSSIQGQGSSGGELLVSANGSLQTNNIQYNKVSPITNYGYLAESSGNTTIAAGCEFENHGILAVNGITNQSEDFLNTGTINCSGHFNNNETGENDGTLNVSGNFTNTGDPDVVFTNNCKIVITGNLTQNRLFHNYGYISVGGNTQLTGSSAKEMNMYAGALIETVNLQVNGELNGPATGCARIDISDQTTIAGQGNVTNYMDLCDENGIETNNGTVGPNVTFCECFVPQTACNPGSGDPQYPDTDGDGVPDDEDDYPDDPTRAFNSYDFSSVAFEDLWPSMGDYDFNDLVVACDYKIVTNAENSVVDLIAKFKIKAGGASLDNGFGFSLPVAPSTVESVTGSQLVGDIITLSANGYEAGHLNNTVVIVYDEINTMLGTSIFNTVPEKPFVETDTTTITVHFGTPQADIGTPPYNAFIFIDHERGKEVHMIDHEPTSKVDATYFGTLNDDSDPATGRYYVTENNLPWAIEIPEDFEYPVEKADILTAYLKFSDWATSGGTSFNDWYLDEPGYRNNTNIYETYLE